MAVRLFYEETLAKVPPRENGRNEEDEGRASWEDVLPHVDAVLGRLINRTPAGEPFDEDGHRQLAHSGVVVDNSKVDWMDRLTYSDLDAGQPSVTIIAIGGNTLSRGLTLEGLVCSYFARTARTYDSLMQMGRWFGYRPGYRHLVRVWTTQRLLDWFIELDQVEKELRDELIWMQENKLRPSEYGPRIRVSPNMNITRAAAMRSVTRQVSYSDTRIDPAWLDLNPEVLDSNIECARTFASGLGAVSKRGDTAGPSVLFRDVPLELVKTFLYSFRFHDEEKRIDMPSLQRYIDREAANLGKWSVAFKSLVRSASTFDYGGSVGSVNTILRGRISNASVALIQSVVDSTDHRIDFNGEGPTTGARYRARDEPPLLVVYAIDPTRDPVRGSNRVALGAKTTPLSVALALPESDSSVEYVAPPIALLEPSPEQDLGDFDDG